MTPVWIGITGASGYIGRAVVARALQQGCEVVTIGRRGVAGLAHRHADLREDPAPDLLKGLDAVIHLAADTGGGGELVAAEIRFAHALASASQRAGLRLLVVSSQAASPNAPSHYGRTKAAIEERVLAHGASVLRPGLVYGGAESGLFGTLVGLVRRIPLLPDLRPRPQVQPIHVDDLAEGLVAATIRNHLPGQVRCVAGAPMTFVEFLAAIARYRVGRRRVRVPVPLATLRIALAGLSRLLGPTLGPERLDSLTRLPPMDCATDLGLLEIRLRPLPDGLSRSGRATRRMLWEGRALMHGFLGRGPSRWLARRYVHALQQHGQHGALDLPRRALAWPSLIAA
ncbi:MAG: NAD-dependent epimerase/dehydratase family protein, partial [Lysobacterales bacterium]